MIRTDSYYEIGAGHMFNQDYAGSGRIATENNLYHYAVISDGCSGSPDSDIGARWYVKMFPRVVRQLALTNQLGAEFVRSTFVSMIEEAAKQLNVDIHAFDATLIATVYDQGYDRLHTYMFGDGKVVYKNKNGTSHVVTASYKSGAPYYFPYLTNFELDALYSQHFGNDYATIQQHILTDALKTVEIREAEMTKQKFWYEEYADASKALNYVSVFSDGIETYHKEEDRDIQMPMSNLVNELTRYKPGPGVFVQRRMQKAKEFAKKEGWTRFDDISVATIGF